MTWFKVDDKFYSHPKVRRLSKGAVALWVRAGAYCADHLTDGVIDLPTIYWLQGCDEEVDELVRAVLWHEHPDGYEFNDWTDYQPSRETVASQRARGRERVAQWRAKQKDDTSSLPDPTRRPERGRNSERNAVTTPSPVDNPADPQTVAAAIADIRSTLRSPR